MISDVRENVSYIFLVSTVLFTLLVLYNVWSIKDNSQPPKEVVQVVRIEGFSQTDAEMEVEKMGLNHLTSFCSSYKGAELETKCNTLARDGCAKVDCCGYLNGSKCVSGSASGPIFLTDVDGEKIVVNKWDYNN